jgi:hypothetical protein
MQIISRTRVVKKPLYVYFSSETSYLLTLVELWVMLVLVLLYPLLPLIPLMILRLMVSQEEGEDLMPDLNHQRNLNKNKT